MMKYLAISVVAVAIISCGSKPKPVPLTPSNPSVQEHLAASEREQQEAAGHEQQAQGAAAQENTATLQCTDDPLENVSYIGGERYKVMRPCWTQQGDSGDWHRKEEKRHRKEAAEHRRMAEVLVAAEARACAELGKTEISQSPLTRRQDILRVEPLYAGKELQGVTLIMRKVPGLSGSWLKRSLACHSARAAALGYPSKFMSECPMSLPGTSAEVKETAEGFSVSIRAKRGEIAAAVLGRAEASQSAKK